MRHLSARRTRVLFIFRSRYDIQSFPESVGMVGEHRLVVCLKQQADDFADKFIGP